MNKTSGHDVIVIGASTGGVEALRDLASRLPENLPAAVFVTIHLPDNAQSALPKILDRAGPLRATHPEDGEEIAAGHIYVAPPHLHLLVESGRVGLGHGPKENRHRPSVDVLFRSAAVAYGRRVVGVVLTGAMNDGTAGLVAVKRHGGVAVVQAPEDALFPWMPASALEYVKVDHVATLESLPSLLTDLAEESSATAEEMPVDDDMKAEVRVARGDLSPPEDLAKFGTPSAFSCPECHGPLWEMQEGNLSRFRCRVGHAFTAECMLAEQSEAVEDALYVALNILKENAGMSERLAENARERDMNGAAARFDERASDARRKAEVIRRTLMQGMPGAGAG